MCIFLLSNGVFQEQDFKSFIYFSFIIIRFSKKKKTVLELQGNLDEERPNRGLRCAKRSRSEYGTHTDYVRFKFFDVVAYRVWHVSAVRVCLRAKITAIRDNAFTITPRWTSYCSLFAGPFNVPARRIVCGTRTERLYEMVNTRGRDDGDRVQTPGGRPSLHRTAGKRVFTRVREDHSAKGERNFVFPVKSRVESQTLDRYRWPRPVTVFRHSESQWPDATVHSPFTAIV